MTVGAINTTPDAGHGIRGRIDLRHGDGQRRSTRQRHGDLHAVQQRHTRTAHAAVTPARQRRSGGTASSGSYTTAATGTDYWVATYNGDSNNNTATSGARPEHGHVDAINTTRRRPRPYVGGSISDTATVSGGQPQQRRTVTFTLYSKARRRTAARRCTPTPAVAERRHGLVGGLHDVGDGHGLLGGHVQRRQQQQHGHQRRRRRAGDRRHRSRRRRQPASATWAGRSPTRRRSAAVSPSSGTVTFTLYSAQPRTAARRCTPSPASAAADGHGLVGGLHDDGDGHGLLGGHVQRRQQQQHGDQRQVRRAGDRRHDHDDADAGQRHRGRVDLRHGDGQRRSTPARHGHVHAVQQCHGTGTPLYTSPAVVGGAAGHGHFGQLHAPAGHRLLGGHVQRRQQQQHGHQRQVRRAGDRRHRSPPASSRPAHRRQLDRRQGNGHRPREPPDRQR